MVGRILRWPAGLYTLYKPLPVDGTCEYDESFQEASRDFPGGPVVKTPCFHCRGCRLDSWLGSQDPNHVLHTRPQEKNQLTL